MQPGHVRRTGAGFCHPGILRAAVLCTCPSRSVIRHLVFQVLPFQGAVVGEVAVTGLHFALHGHQAVSQRVRQRVQLHVQSGRKTIRVLSLLVRRLRLQRSGAQRVMQANNEQRT